MKVRISHYLLSTTIALLLLCGLATPQKALAAPAKPGTITVTQADGTQLKIILRGDEFFSWRTTESGYPITLGDDGNYYYAEYETSGTIRASAQRVSIGGVMQAPQSSAARNNIATIASKAAAKQRSARSQEGVQRASSGFPSEGTIKSAIILVEYSDVAFSIDNPNQAFYNQLNEEGYSVEGATGSAKDYFSVNSRGKFDGEFDVYGPYTLSNIRSYYGGNDSDGYDLRPDKMVWDAVIMADEAGVDFSQYDYDEDGYIDNIFVYYAGHNEAEGGHEDSIWPHKWAVASRPEFDGKMLYVYACSSELRGNSGTIIAGIGTFCHEFSHVFGLADHYDTTGTTDGYSYGLGYYDIMSAGNYNNSGNTPPLHNGLELDMIGWNTPTVIDATQNIDIAPIQEGEVYKILTEVEDEYFLIENRQKSSTVWDSYISASGLFITHVDRSSSYINKWYYNAPNGDSSHECFRFIVAGNALFSTYNEGIVPYPYNGNNEWGASSAPMAQSWAGEPLDFDIKNITQNSDYSMSFSVEYSGATSSFMSIECNRNNIFVDSRFTLTATLTDPPQIGAVVWESSNESITECSTEGNVLSVKFTAAGSATFTASYISDGGETLSVMKTVLTAKVLQGATGYILDQNTLEPIPNASLGFYPVTRSSSADFQASTDEYGEYVVELAKGCNYEVAVDAAGYASLFEMIYIDEGANNFSFTMSNYADTVTDLSIETTQSSATLIWNPQGYTSFKVDLQSGNTINSATVENDSKYTFKELNPATTYSVTISDSDKNTLYSSDFTTLGQTTTIPLIYLDSYEYSVGDVISLALLNSESSDTVSWYYNNTSLQADKVTLNSIGEHTIKAVVVRGSETYSVNRIISVK